MQPNDEISSATPEAAVQHEAVRSEHSHGEEHEVRASMPAAEALAILRRGEPVQHVRIVGLQLRGEFEHAVKLRNVTLVSPVIGKAEFRADVVFAHCTLDRPRFQPKTTFARDLDVSSSMLIKPIFKGITVEGTLQAGNVQTKEQILFQDCRFEGRVRFWEAHLNGWVEFARCTFAAEADFRSLHAQEGFVMNKCRFEADVLFRGATIAKKWDATDSRFEALLDLSKAKLHDFVYLEGIEQGARQRFAFQNALAERILIRTDQLTGRLASKQAGDYALAMQEFALLKRSFSNLHRFDQEDWAFYQFKVSGRRACPRSWWRPWTKLAEFGDWLLLDLGCGYGTHPLRAVTASLIIILMFAIIYGTDPEALYVQKLPFEGRGLDYLPNRIVVALMTSVSVFTAGFSSLRDYARGWMNMPLILESLLGTFLWGLFIVAFSRKVIR
jgi:hypothetical protein